MDEVVGREATPHRAEQETREAGQESPENRRHGGRELPPAEEGAQETRGGGRGGQERAQRGRR
eukprot:3074634-Heterocapsa_arctica.AAC.1